MGAPWKGSRICNHIRCYREEILGRLSAQKLNQNEAAKGTSCYHNYLLSDDCRTAVDVDAMLPSLLCGFIVRSAAFSPSLGALFQVPPPSRPRPRPFFHPGTQNSGPKKAQLFIYLLFFLVRSRWQIGEGLASARTCGCWPQGRSRGAEAKRTPRLLHFKQKPAPVGAQGLICLNGTRPRCSSLLAFKQEEITDDDIRVGDSEE